MKRNGENSRKLPPAKNKHIISHIETFAMNQPEDICPYSKTKTAIKTIPCNISYYFPSNKTFRKEIFQFSSVFFFFPNFAYDGQTCQTCILDISRYSLAHSYFLNATNSVFSQNRGLFDRWGLFLKSWTFSDVKETNRYFQVSFAKTDKKSFDFQKQQKKWNIVKLVKNVILDVNKENFFLCFCSSNF